MLFWIIFLLLSHALTFAQPSYDYCSQASSMVKTIQNFHYNPKPIDNSFSEHVFDSFIEALDPQGRVFTEEDLSKINVYRVKIDDEINNRSCVFLEKVLEMYRQKLLIIETIIMEVMAIPLDFQKEDKIAFGMHQGTVQLAKNNEELKKRWQQWLKYQTLILMFSIEEEDSIQLTLSLQDYLKNEAISRERIKNRETCRIDKILNHPMGFEKFISSQFLKCIALAFDPHTDFFSAYDIRLFEASISKDAFSYGIHIDENENGDIVISSITPGSPAWNASDLTQGDIILRLETSDKKSHDFMCMDIFEAYESLYTTDEHEIKLIIKKTNGQIKSVNLKKEKMEMEENVVQSFILKGEKKIGYISLPGFYTQLEDDEAIGCANDVAKEIIKMKQEKIEGLILDLRFNGGGSMKEALELTGLFIDQGPVTVAVNKDKLPVVMKDVNRGAIYTGPMVVMVNSMSASASEIFSAALQDYNRALIVGDVTYGKATGQIVLPLEGINVLPNKMSGEFVKVTVEKFFRLNGKTHQKTGVTPDIFLTDYYGKLPLTEKTKGNALSNDTISKKTYYQPLKSLPLAELAKRSSTRLSNDSCHIHLRSILKDDFTHVQFRLLPELFQQDFNKYNNWIDSIDRSSSKVVNAYRANALGNNDHLDYFLNEFAASLAEEVQSSIYIEEAYYIINDLIDLTKNQ